jgi:hypothetical protein
VEVIPGIYKFGLSVQLINRLKTHLRQLNFIKIITVIDCVHDTVMQRVETEFKRYIKTIGIQRDMFNQTEIIETDDINQYVKWFNDRVELYNKEPQPANKRNLPILEGVKDDIVEDVAVDPPINENKCYKCGKEFKRHTELVSHKKRKTPCLIREVPPGQLDNPNRCIYCNKVLSTLGNKNKHLKSCKIKNGGMDILDDKVRHEREMCIMKEKQDASDNQIDELKHQNHEIMQQLAKLVEQNALIITQMTAISKNAAD